LQVTFQASTEEEARLLYDNLIPFTPIMLALSAGTPIYRGYLSDWDTRWNILSDGADDRTPEERGLHPLNEQKFRVPKTRHSTVDCYLHPESMAYNDIEIQYDHDHLNRLTEGGIDLPLAQHIAHLFIRDPLQVFKESLAKLNSPEDDHDDGMEFFEDIQSSNWNNVRFKPPPITDAQIGWRVEFRTMEPQITDFENSAYICFVVLLTRVILSQRLSFLIPMSKNDINIVRASEKDAVLTQKFYFRRWTKNDSPKESDIRDGLDYDKKQSLNLVENESSQRSSTSSSEDGEIDDPQNSFVEMTIDEIINGQERGEFPGVLAMINKYLNSVEVDVDTRRTIDQYLGLIQDRARGDLWTLARFMRQYVQQHESYQKDSVVSDEIQYDLIKKLNEISENRAKCPRLTGHRDRSSSLSAKSSKSTLNSNDSRGSLQSSASQKSM
jgi:glutamate--cysteine ligase catalytic subunit